MPVRIYVRFESDVSAERTRTRINRAINHDRWGKPRNFQRQHDDAAPVQAARETAARIAINARVTLASENPHS